MTRILLVRHGHVDGISPERFRGRRDVPLSAQGLHQARAVAQYIRDNWQPSLVYSSPLQRCIRTGQEIASACEVSVAPLHGLIDLDYGAWEWQTHEEVQAHWAGDLELWRRAPQYVRFPNGESLQELSARVADVLRLILSLHPDKTLVLVSHDSTNRVLLLQLLGLPLSSYWSLVQDPCGLSEADVTPERTRILRINETQHLHRRF